MREFTAKQYVDLWISAEEGTAKYPPHSIYQYITSPYPQMGKSNAAMYCANRVLEELHGWKFDLDNLVWDVPTFLERRKIIREWDIIIPDEMQRNAGNRTWQTEDNAIVGEEMETGSFEHKHVMMTVPSKHRLDKLIADVCTSQMVIDKTDVHNRMSWVSLYSLERGQLDRTSRERTPGLGTMTLGSTEPEFWAAYLKRKKNYFDDRREIHLQQAKAILTEATQPRTNLTVDQIESLIMSEPERCMDPRKKGFSLSRVRVYLKDHGYGQVPYWRVQEGTAQANEHARLSKQVEVAEQSA